MDREVIKRSVFFGVGAAFGAGVIYAILDRENKRKYRDIAEDEIESVKEAYKQILVEHMDVKPVENGETVTDRDVAHNYMELMDAKREYDKQVNDLGYTRTEVEAQMNRKDAVEAETEAVQHLNAFDRSEPPTFDDRPHVITLDEFMQDQPEFDKLTITYYVKDNTLSDERDQIIDDVERIISREALNWFGYKAGSDDVVHVRNMDIATDFEVLRDPGRYTESVLGIPSLEDVGDDE